MTKFAVGAAVFCLAFATLPVAEGPARAQTRAPEAQTNALTTRTYLGCYIDSGRHLFLRNTTSAVLRVGTPVYWSGKQAGHQPREYRAPLYANVSPGGVYQAGASYRYDPTVPCRVWIMRRPTATLAP